MSPLSRNSRTAFPAGPWRWVLAVVGGLLWASAFGRHPWTIVSLVALVPLLLLLDEGQPRRRFLLGWLHGTVFWIAAIPWIAHTLSTYGQLPRPLSYVLLLLLALYLGVYHGLFLLVGGKMRGRLALAGLPALWVVLESIEAWMFSGFPWNLAAYAWTAMPGALPASAWIGAAGVSFLVVLVNTALVLGWRERRRGQNWGQNWGWPLVALLVPILVLSAAFLGGGLDETTTTEPASPVHIIQPNIATSMTVDWPKIAEDYGRIFSLSRDACSTPGALLVWPESAAWPFSFSETDPLGPRLVNDLEALTELGCPVLFNSVYREEEHFVRNSAFLLEPSGKNQRYDKRHLVPWGEYVPLAKVLPFVRSLARNAGDFHPAEEIRLLDWGREKIGMGICYEMIFPGEVAASVREGATVLATISNDAWYGDSSARAQHFRAARFRAAESRRPLMRAALNGISALVAADGSIVEELGPDKVGVISGNVQGRTDLSPYSRRPWLVPLLCWLLTAFAIVPRGSGTLWRSEP